ncbi:type II secretion system F family protein [Paraclostridium bifermentans]|uniref:type II secretion system F family protein n=1 Tax=Paraclostridium bifermentans TaxID=1490 RepID=UPI00359C6A4C
MKEFKYTAIMLNGKKVSSTVMATDYTEAKKLLKEKKMRIIELKEKKVSALFTSKKSKKKKLKSDQISHFCRQFGIIISSGINSMVGLETLGKKSPNKLLSDEINRIVNDIKMGSTIASSMLDKQSKFPKLLGAMVATGEETGTLEEVLANMATFYEREHKINQKIKNASMYPAIVAITSFVMLFVFTSFILPQMIDTITETGAKLPLMTKIVMHIGNFMKNYWYLVLIVGVLLFYQLKIYVKTPVGKMHKDRIINKIPLLGKGINSIVSMRFSRALYLFVSTGYPMLQGLDHIKDSLNNSIAEKAVVNAKEGIIRGETLAENLEKSKYFDPVLIQMIAIGEQTGELEKISKQMAEFYESESEIYLNRMVAMIEPIMIIIVGIMVGILVISVFLPMLSIYDAI